MGRQIGHDATLQRTPSHDGPRKGAQNHCQHDATWTTPPWATRFLQPTPQLIDQTTYTEMACDEIKKMKKKVYESQVTSPTPITATSSEMKIAFIIARKEIM